MTADLFKSKILPTSSWPFPIFQIFRLGCFFVREVSFKDSMRMNSISIANWLNIVRWIERLPS